MRWTAYGVLPATRLPPLLLPPFGYADGQRKARGVRGRASVPVLFLCIIASVSFSLSNPSLDSAGKQLTQNSIDTLHLVECSCSCFDSTQHLPSRLLFLTSLRYVLTQSQSLY